VRSLHRHGIENGIVDGGVDFQSGRMTFVLLLNLANMPEQFKGLIHSACTSFLGDAWQRISDGQSSGQLDHVPRLHVRVSPAEKQVLELLRLGKTNWEIGQILGKSELTIKTQLRRLYIKTQTSNRTQLTALIP
jgi:DNA-binding CsgD family transcriptional regulator